ncbi:MULTISPECIES: hypothetical protein [unclassified Fibrobacter]|uniref:hypothetical protein n=1 Tax=unclassified Fibrobacter TaxID=2634177 RepID=UPI00091446E2|nr:MULTISPECIES: hypothetical protein [unclassified Fibrobacter]SHK96590.1 hypothetical protein SAMN05720759_11091 [Fibrobacter sp. UWB12]SIO32958.1 hypothetical protein SAMN05720758_2326 [Fibrobacter sp. UWB11]
MNFKLIFAAAALLATQSFAIAGIGAHYTPAVGTTLKEAQRADIKGTDGKIGFSHGSFDYIQGFGFKAWVDVLPFVDIEATFNIQFASYNAALWVGEGEDARKIPLEIELGGTPFAKATPKYIAMNADLSVTKPFSIPLFPIRPYVGGGLTIHWNTFVLNKAFVENVMDKAFADGNYPADEDEFVKALKDKVVDYAKDEGLTKSIGIHLLAGVRFKLPIIPIAAYANVKCYLGGDYDSDIDAGNFAFEIGGGFAL